jgi:hypothetical protein
MSDRIHADDKHSETHPPSTLTDGHLLPPSSISGDHILTVDWDSPDDPENPRKYVRHYFPSAFVSMWLHMYVVGTSARSGVPPSSCLRSPSSALSHRQ